jgi:hypothetical protein
MKILYILKQDPDDTVTDFIEAHRRSNEVNVIDIRQNKNYSHTIDLIENSDKIISW